jgi:hypothetical protein
MHIICQLTTDYQEMVTFLYHISGLGYGTKNYTYGLVNDLG